jgi:hypothetical protein
MSLPLFRIKLRKTGNPIAEVTMPIGRTAPGTNDLGQDGAQKHDHLDRCTVPKARQKDQEG